MNQPAFVLTYSFLQGYAIPSFLPRIVERDKLQWESRICIFHDGQEYSAPRAQGIYYNSKLDSRFHGNDKRIR